MGETTGISWTDHTFNPWEGCQRVSPGCEHCYAEARNARFHPELVGWPEDMPKRTGKGLHWGPPSTTDRLLRKPAYWKEPERWNAAAKKTGKRARVFCASLADVFEDHPQVVEERAKLFDLIERTPSLDWQLLTKRPQNMIRLAPSRWRDGWPPNVWAGTTAEDAKHLQLRARSLRQVPARVRFLSCEPLLGALDGLLEEVAPCDACVLEHDGRAHTCRKPRIHWVIVGGESGPRARPFDMLAARQIVANCAELGVACFVKQMGDNPIDGSAGVSLGRAGVHAFKAHHGADPREWPGHLRVQQFPKEAL